MKAVWKFLSRFSICQEWQSMPELGLEDSRRQLFGIFICFELNLFQWEEEPLC